MDERPKVVRIRTGGEVLPPGTPNPEVVALCEDLLERARSGDLKALSAALQHSDGGHSYRHKGPIGYSQIGTLACLQGWLVNAWNDE